MGTFNVETLLIVNIWNSEVVPPTSGGSIFIPGGGDIIFINPFLLRQELSPNIVAILECTKRMEYGMQSFPR